MWKRFCIIAFLSTFFAYLSVIEEPLDSKIEFGIFYSVTLAFVAGFMWLHEYFVYKKKYVTNDAVSFCLGLISLMILIFGIILGFLRSLG